MGDSPATSDIKEDSKHMDTRSVLEKGIVSNGYSEGNQNHDQFKESSAHAI